MGAVALEGRPGGAGIAVAEVLGVALAVPAGPATSAAKPIASTAAAIDLACTESLI